MDIDLLLTREGEVGLICSQNLVKKAAGVVFDHASGNLTLEFVDMDYMEMNIPVEEDFHGFLENCAQIHVGAVKDGHIAQAYQVPFMLLDDPYRAEALKNVRQPKNPLLAFENFIKRCVAGQPAHREDLGNEESMGCVLGDASPSALKFAPHLARRHALEATPKMAPRGPGPSTPGLGSSGGGTASRGLRSPPANEDGTE
jgi:hypothetical protein